MIVEFTKLDDAAGQYDDEAGRFVVDLVKKIADDPRVEAVLMAGSPLAGTVDRWSDVDLTVVCAADDHAGMMVGRQDFAKGMGRLLSAFTGEHVGEPRLLICLYDAPLLHVDMKFIRVEDVNPRVEDPLVLWDRTGRTRRELAQGAPRWPNAELGWFEDRAWIWLHYGVAKLGRGELYEALNMLTFFREQVLGPMIAKIAGRNQRGVRHLEKDVHISGLLIRTTAVLDRDALLDAYAVSLDLYLHLHESIAGTRSGHPAREPVEAYLSMVRNA